MWRFLLQAGLGAATLNVGLRMRRLKRMAVLLAIAGVFALLGFAALLVAAGILIEPHLGAAGAAGAVGGAVLAVAALLAWASTWEPRRRAAGAPVVDRVRSELRAAGDALSSGAPRLGDGAGFAKGKGLNIVLLATLAGVILGRRL